MHNIITTTFAPAENCTFCTEWMVHACIIYRHVCYLLQYNLVPHVRIRKLYTCTLLLQHSICTLYRLGLGLMQIG